MNFFKDFLVNLLKQGQGRCDRGAEWLRRCARAFRPLGSQNVTHCKDDDINRLASVTRQRPPSQMIIQGGTSGHTLADVREAAVTTLEARLFFTIGNCENTFHQGIKSYSWDSVLLSIPTVTILVWMVKHIGH